MAEEIKRTYNIPLRSGFVKKPKYRRSKVCMRIIKEFLAKHMKSEDIKLGPKLNEEVWKHGIKNPPHHVKIDVIKDKEGSVRAELFGFEFKDKKIETKKESIKDRLMNKVAGPQQTVIKKTKEDTADKKVEVKTEKSKVVEKKVDSESKKEVKPAEEKNSQ